MRYLTLILTLHGVAPAQVQSPQTGEKTPVRILAQDFDIRATRPAVQATRTRSRDGQSNSGLEAQYRRQGTPVRTKLTTTGTIRSLASRGKPLTPVSADSPEQIARQFLTAHAAAFGLGTKGPEARLIGVENNSAMTVVRLIQTVDGIDVFEGLMRVTLNAKGQVLEAGVDAIASSNQLADSARLSPAEAVAAAFNILNLQPAARLEPEAEKDGRISFHNPGGSHLTPVTVAKSVFPDREDTAILAYRILLEVDGANWFDMLLDASSGRLLYLHNIYRFARASVFQRSPIHGPQVSVGLQEGWLAPDVTVTTGNNTDVYLDGDGNNQPDPLDGPGLQNGRAFSPSRDFVFESGDRLSSRDPREHKPATVSNLFYIVNAAHDYFYRLGFTESSFNFQKDNFGKGGEANDYVIVEAQDGRVNDNANFASTPDGVRPRMQLGINTYGLRDGTRHTDNGLDSEVVVHEYAHGVTNRMVGAGREPGCLSGTQSRAMGEGWSDYFAASYHNATILFQYPSLNPYRGWRRHGLERYPYTFEDLGNEGFESHRDGEIWSAALWEIRKLLGRDVADKLVVAALALTPCRPSMVDARDAIFTVDQALNGGANRSALWKVFAARGLGDSAEGVDGGFRIPTVFVAAYDMPADLQPGNRAPQVPEVARVPKVGANSDFTMSLNATDPEGSPLRYTLLSGPAGMTVNATTGAVRWRAGMSDEAVQVAVEDAAGARIVYGFQVAVETHVRAAAPLPIPAFMEGRVAYAIASVPEGSDILQVKLRDGTGDGDLILLNPNGIVQGASSRDGNDETLSIAAPAAGNWMIVLLAYRSMHNARLAMDVPEPETLSLQSARADLSGDLSSQVFFRIEVPQALQSLRVRTSGGTGDVDVYVRKDRIAACQTSFLVSTSAPCGAAGQSTRTGNGEEVVLNSVAPGTYFVTLSGAAKYTGVTLEISSVQ